MANEPSRPSRPFDATLKHLVEADPAAWLAFLGLPVDVPAATIDADLSTVLAAADKVAASYDAVGGDEWERRGTRSDGSVFTVDTLGRYHLHDVLHHLWDVRWLGTETAG